MHKHHGKAKQTHRNGPGAVAGNGNVCRIEPLCHYKTHAIQTSHLLPKDHVAFRYTAAMGGLWGESHNKTTGDKDSVLYSCSPIKIKC